MSHWVLNKPLQQAIVDIFLAYIERLAVVPIFFWWLPDLKQLR